MGEVLYSMATIEEKNTLLEAWTPVWRNGVDSGAYARGRPTADQLIDSLETAQALANGSRVRFSKAQRELCEETFNKWKFEKKKKARSLETYFQQTDALFQLVRSLSEVDDNAEEAAIFEDLDARKQIQ